MTTTEASTLKEFLDKFRTYDNTYSHIGCGGIFKGKFNIPDGDDIKKFNKFYKRAFESGAKLYLLENHLSDCSPIKIDIDLKYDKSKVLKEGKKHFYKSKDVKDFIGIYMKYLNDVIDIKEDVMIVVMEKECADKDKNGGWRDGFHIMFPWIVCDFNIPKYIRGRMIEDRVIDKLFTGEGLVIDSNQIFDKAVICDNNWTVYGSVGGPGKTNPYMVSNVYKYSVGSSEIVKIKKKDIVLKKKTWFRELSIRKNCGVNIEYVSDEIKKEVKKSTMNVIKKKYNMTGGGMIETVPVCNINNVSEEELETARELVKILKLERAVDYNLWTQVGWCLHNIDREKMYDSFIEFSKRCSNKYDEESCMNLWERAQEGLTMASLHFWAKEDNLELYQEIMSKHIQNSLEQFNKGHLDIAQIVHSLYRHEFVYVVDIKKVKTGWYWFHNHRWVYQPNGKNLRDRITEGLRGYYDETFRKYITKSAGCTSETEKKIYDANAKDSKVIWMKLGTNDFIERVMKECTFKFQDMYFLDMLDRNPYLIGFNNGVYDLMTDTFRDGIPGDYISKNTKIDYIPSNKINKSKRDDIFKFFKEILPNKHVRNYMLMVLASSLDYVNREEKFYIIIGKGRNGKSLLINLHQDCLGEYTCALPVQLITQKRGDSGRANPEIVKMDLKRFCLIKEPDSDNISLNIGIIKELTGNDLISARNLHSNDDEFRVSSKLMLMTNYLPDVYSDDVAIWDRIKVIQFPMHFVEPDKIKNKESDRPIDKGLKEKIKEWRSEYMSILLDYYKVYRTSGGIDEPKEITDATKEYRQRNNYLLQFIEDNIEEGNSRNKITVDVMYKEYSDWFSTEYEGKKKVMKREFKSFLVSHYGSAYNSKNNEVKGVKFVDDNDDVDTEVEEDDN